MKSDGYELVDLPMTEVLACLREGGRVENDSRRIEVGDIFLACRGEFHDGRSFIEAALARGARAVIWDADDTFSWHEGWNVPNLGVRGLSENVGMLAALALGNVHEQATPLNIVGVTGTNGKTSLTHWLAQAWTMLGDRAAVIGTVGNGVWGELSVSTHTTPDPVRVQHLLAQFRAQSVQSVAMEVSSHGLVQHRVVGVPFRTAIFTNLTRDHLDYHGSMDEYAASKRHLFRWQALDAAILNVDDEWGARWSEETCANRVVRYGFSHGDVRVRESALSLSGMRLRFEGIFGDIEFETPLLGRFNVHNLLAITAALGVEGRSSAQIADILSKIQATNGRMQTFGGENSARVIVDYAHTPDALEKVLSTLRECAPASAKLGVVFGCGGDRDAGKRPQMGEIAARFADWSIVTNDNPRSEAPEMIVADILRGFSDTSVVGVELDRKQAIISAISRAQSGDIVVIAGKGHETYQEIKGTRHYFCDAEEVMACLEGKHV